MVLIKASKATGADVPPSQELLSEMKKFNEILAKAGVLLAGEGLHPSSLGTRVMFSGAQRTVLYGPSSETNKLIAGFWLWECRSLCEAIGWAEQCPNPFNGEGEIEIRQAFEGEDFADTFISD
jgi:hypothetical protein